MNLNKIKSPNHDEVLCGGPDGCADCAWADFERFLHEGCNEESEESKKAKEVKEEE